MALEQYERIKAAETQARKNPSIDKWILSKAGQEEIDRRTAAEVKKQTSWWNPVSTIEKKQIRDKITSDLRQEQATKNAMQMVNEETRKKSATTNTTAKSIRSATKPSTQKSIQSVNQKPEDPKPTTEARPPQLEGFAASNIDTGSRISTIGKGTTQVFDINSFRSEIIKNDVLPSHSYLVTFAPFRAGVGKEVGPLTDFVVNKRNTLMMRCENVVLPTPSLLEEENIRRYGYGPVEKVPYGVQFSDVSITWLVDKNSEIIDFMHQWMNTIVMHDSPNTLMSYGAPTRPGLDAYAPFEVGYKDAYANPIVRVYVYNRQQQIVTEYEMYDVFPMNIQSMNLSWSDENQVQKLTVTFAYTNMQVKAPLKTNEAQFNYYLEGRTNPYEEKQQPNNKGGRAAEDKKDSPANESIKKTIKSSNPDIKSGGNKPTAGSTNSQPVVRTF